ncbi:MAG: hypothetical protein IT368_07960 [Candidatus Hydrogenedentes bacterium]|nr:hypothetical protein [Candidatus Hydrogenedentota bacterium]
MDLSFLNPRYVVDDDGKQCVMLPVEDYERLVNALEVLTEDDFDENIQRKFDEEE